MPARRLPPGILRELAAFIPDSVTTVRLLRKDPRIPRKAKIAILIAGIWVASPIDLIPEFIPVIEPGGELLGLGHRTFFPVPGSEATDQAEARAMHLALWPATWGYHLKSMLWPMFSGPEGLITQPRGGRGTWEPGRLEHRFRIGAPGHRPGEPERVLSAEEYPGGHFDWYSFSVDRDPPNPMGANDPAARTAVTRTVIPSPVRYAGMPHSRWWAFEDGRTNFGAMNADTADLIRVMFLEFALVYGDDWLLLSCDVEAGTLTKVDGMSVTDVFGQRFWTNTRRLPARGGLAALGHVPPDRRDGSPGAFRRAVRSQGGCRPVA